jgi:hypothetical protein
MEVLNWVFFFFFFFFFFFMKIDFKGLFFLNASGFSWVIDVTSVQLM